MQLTEQDKRLIRQIVHEDLNSFMQNTVSNVRNAGRQGVDAVRVLWRKNNNNGQPAKTNNGKPGFFSGAFTAAANSLTDGAYGKLNQMYQQNKMQKAYGNNDKSNANARAKYDGKLFNFWTQNVEGDFTPEMEYVGNKWQPVKDIYGRTPNPGNEAVNLWNQWYRQQVGSSVRNVSLDRYIYAMMNDAKNKYNPKAMSWEGFTKHQEQNPEMYKQPTSGNT